MRINEFLASNKDGISTATGDTEDWIELRNMTAEDINLAGWSLTDSSKNLTKFQFPTNGNILIRANSFFLLYASSSESMIVGGQWHANFSLSKDGEYLALVRPDGTIEDEIAPTYPEQYTDISYGVIENGDASVPPQYGYFTTPTPRQANGADAILHGRVASPTLDQPRGFYTSRFYVNLACNDPLATLRYTTDGSEPTESSSIFSISLLIKETTVMRTRAFREGYLPSAVKSCTWIFLNDVLTQSTMRKRIINDANYSAPLLAGLKDIPSISISTDSTNLYGATGIFDNYGESGEDWERPVSVELLSPDGDTGDEFEIYAGMRIRGATGRASAKKSLRLLFGSTYEGDLEFPLFGNEGVNIFSKVDLRTEQNNAWSSNVDSPWQNTFVREVFSRDTQRDLGDLYTRSRYYHVYINGVYWGIYMTQERGEADFSSSYLGGVSDEWDALKSSSSRVIEVKDGSSDAYNQFYQYAKQGFTGQYEKNYWTVRGLNANGTRNPDLPILLEEENLIHYILLTTYTADVDSPLSWINVVNNVNTVYHRADPLGFLWLKHDAELSLGAHLGVEDSIEYFSNRTYWSGWNNFNPMDLHRKLIQHPEYYQHFMDEAEKLYRNNGVLTYTNALDRWNQRMETIQQPIIAESARWGNQHGGGYTWESWKRACHQVTQGFLVGREYETLSLLKKHDWHSDLEAPLLSTNGTTITIQSHENAVYYTLDGTDPRAIGGGMSSTATALSVTPLAQNLLTEDILPANSLWRCYDTGSEPESQTSYSSIPWSGRLYSDYDWAEKAPAKGLQSSPAYLRKSFVLERTDDIDHATLTLLKGSGTILINGVTCKKGFIPLANLRPGRNLVVVTTSSTSGFDLSIAITRKSNYWNTGTLSLENDTFKNLQLKVRSLSNSSWSPLAELDYRNLHNPDCSTLRVTEMMYSSPVTTEETELGYSNNDFSWLEFRNVGEVWINLQGVTFTAGIEYTFPNAPLAPGAYLVLAKNPTAFATRYGTNKIQLLGGYDSNLARKGETISAVDTANNVLFTFTYSNTWYPETDRGGYTLSVIDTEAEMSTWSTAANWKPSQNMGGTPGTGYDGTVDPPIINPPTLTKQPAANQAVLVGTSVLFTVTATGTAPLAYQWYKDGTILEGATENSFAIPSAQLTDAGQYTVVVRNKSSSVTSNAATLSVREAGFYSDAILFHRYSFTPQYVNQVLVAIDDISAANGTLYGNATLSTNEDSSGFLALDGWGDVHSLTEGSFLALPPDLIKTFDSFSIEMWARANKNNGDWMRLFDFGSTILNTDGTIARGGNYTMTTWKAGHSLCNGVTLNGAENQVYAPYLPIGDGIFHHIVYTYKSETKIGTLYTDGAYGGSGTQEFNPTQWPDGCPYMWIGKSLWPDPYFIGDFDEFRIYKGVLTAEEIADNYTLGADHLDANIEPTLTYTLKNNQLHLDFTGTLEESEDLIHWKKIATPTPYTVPVLEIGINHFYRATNK